MWSIFYGYFVLFLLHKLTKKIDFMMNKLLILGREKWRKKNSVTKTKKEKKCLPIILRKSPYNLFLLESFFARSVSFLWYFCLRFRWNDIKIWTKSVCNIYNDKTTANIDTFYCSSNLNKNLIWRICIRTSFGVAWSGAGLVKCGKKFLWVEDEVLNRCRSVYRSVILYDRTFTDSFSY